MAELPSSRFMACCPYLIYSTKNWNKN